MKVLSRTLIMGHRDIRAAALAERWLVRKLSFNKENPVDLLSQLVKTLEQARERTEGDAADRLNAASRTVRETSREVNDAWRRRNDE